MYMVSMIIVRAVTRFRRRALPTKTKNCLVHQAVSHFFTSRPTTANVLRQAQLDILLKDVSRWPGTWAADPSRHDCDDSLPRGNESASAELIGGFAVMRTRQAQSGPWALTQSVFGRAPSIVRSKEGTELLKGSLDLLITMSS